MNEHFRSVAAAAAIDLLLLPDAADLEEESTSEPARGRRSS
jgi:hypothetical protein